MDHRAYATLAIKSVDVSQRVIEGIASTPTIDRGGDSMDPLGATFSLPMPLKWKHGEGVGEVFEATVKPDGIYIKAKFSALAADAPDVLKSRIETAWHSIIAQPPLARGLSIGWSGLQSEPIAGRKGTRWRKWIWGETSVVEVPMNTEATITAIKSIDDRDLAASGTDPIVPNSPAGATALPVLYGRKDARAMAAISYTEQITDLSNRRAANEARLGEIQQKATGEGRTKDEAEQEEFKTLRSEITAMDAELKDLRDLEQMNRERATPITAPLAPISPNGDVKHHHVLSVRPNVPPGTAFARMCMAMAAGHGDSYQTMQHAKRWKDSTPEVEQMIEHMWQTKAAVAAGTTTDSTWAGPLVVTQPLNEFLELLRPRTLLGRIPGLRRVPFNVSVPTQTTGGTYGWVGQNKPKPVTKADYSTVTVPFAKAAGIIVISEELATLSTPSAEALVREEMIAGMGAFLDVQFQDPAVAAVSNVSPASITNGASTAAASGATAANAKADLAASIAVFTAAGIPLDGAVWIMNDSNAFGLSVSLNALGQPLFPSMTAQGGTLFGLPVIVSNHASTRVILVHAPSILIADEGGVRVDVSREASVQMDSTPTDTVDATTVYISLWQRNLIGLKAERMITWIRARSAAVRYITAAAYTGA